MIVSHEELKDHIIKIRDKHIAIHGHGRDADRAHLHEILHTVENLPPYVRHRMQLAYNRHLMRDKMEAYQKSVLPK